MQVLTEKEMLTLHYCMLDYCKAKGLEADEYIEGVYKGLLHDGVKHDIAKQVRILTNYHREWLR